MQSIGKGFTRFVNQGQCCQSVNHFFNGDIIHTVEHGNAGFHVYGMIIRVTGGMIQQLPDCDFTFGRPGGIGRIFRIKGFQYRWTFKSRYVI